MAHKNYVGHYSLPQWYSWGVYYPVYLTQWTVYNIIFFVAQQLKSGPCRLFVEVSRSHTVRQTYSAWILWKSDQLVAETTTYTTHNIHGGEHPCPQQCSNPWFQQSRGRWPTPNTARPSGSAQRSVTRGIWRTSWILKRQNSVLHVWKQNIYDNISFAKQKFVVSHRHKWAPRCGGSRSHLDTPHVVGLLGMSDQSVTKTSTWQHTTTTTDKYPCPRRE